MSSGANMPIATNMAFILILESLDAFARGILTWTAVYTQSASVMTQLRRIPKVPRPGGSALLTQNMPH